MPTSPYAVPTSPGSAWLDYLSTLLPMFREEFDLNPRTGFGAYASVVGDYAQLGNNFREWLGDQYERLYTNYLREAGSDPTYWWVDYLGTLNPLREFALATPRARGERPELMSPTMRMVI